MAAYCVANDVYLESGLSVTEVASADITSLIVLADAEIDAQTKQSFQSGTARTEYLSVYLPKRADDLTPTRVMLSYYPVQSITSFLLLDGTGGTQNTLDTLSSTEISAGTYDSANYHLDPNTGLIELISLSFDYVPRRAKVGYTSGYAAVPTIVKELSACLAGIRAWVKFLGGSYNRLDNYSLPEQSYNKGNFFDRGKTMMESLQKKADFLLNQITRKQLAALQASSGGYY